MNDYMKALHHRFFHRPDCTELRAEIDQLYSGLREKMDRPEQSKLLQLVDVQNLLKEEISLASFTTGFKLAWGMAQELWADGPYSFDEEQMG